jgi:LEA14-like dessication related protein
MKINRSLPLLFLLLGALLNSCGVIYKDVEIHGIKNIELVKFENDGMIIEADVTINNPNFYGIDVTDSDLKIYLNDVVLGNASFLGELNLVANFEEKKHLTIKTIYRGKMSNTLKSVFGLAMGKEMLLRIEGEVTGKVMGISSSFEVLLEEKVKL